MKNFILSLFLVFSSSSFAHKCQISQGSFFEHEREIRRIASEIQDPLKGRLFVKKAEHAFKCLAIIQSQSTGFTKALCTQFIGGLIGNPTPDKLDNDPSYQLVRLLIENELKASSTVLRHKVFGFLSAGEWSLHQPFCEKYSAYICKGFLHQNNGILKQSPVLAAISVSSIAKASSHLPARDQKDLERQLLALAKRVPLQNPILKKAVAEALEQIRQPVMSPLS